MHDEKCEIRTISSIIRLSTETRWKKNGKLAEKTREDRRSRFERPVFNEAPAASIFAAFDKWSARGKNENYAPVHEIVRA